MEKGRDSKAWYRGRTVKVGSRGGRTLKRKVCRRVRAGEDGLGKEQ